MLPASLPVSTSTSAFANLSVQSAPLVSIPLSLPEIPIAPPVVATMIDPDLRNARFVSHMPAIFTEQWQREQELQEEKRKQDAHRALVTERAAHSAIIYAWSEDGKSPEVHEFQSGFTWPYFSLTAHILSTVNLMSSDSRVQLYRNTLGTWVTITIDHVIQLSEGMRIFLKSSHVNDPVHFEKHVRADSLTTTPNLRYNLPEERRELRRRQKCREGEAVESIELSSDDEAVELQGKTKKRLRSRSPPMQRSVRKRALPPSLFQPTPSTTPSASTSATPILDLTEDQAVTPKSLSNEDTESDCPAPRTWPAHYHAVDIVAMFEDCQEHAESPNKAIFQLHFPGVTFRKSTFHENLMRWIKAPQAVRDTMLKAGRSKEGLWSVFHSQTRGWNK
jgi:hypothetical protein